MSNNCESKLIFKKYIVKDIMFEYNEEYTENTAKLDFDRKKYDCYTSC